MTEAIDLSADHISVEDITDRVDELREELTERHEAGGFMSDFSDWIKNSRDNSDPVHAAFPDDGADVQEQIEELYKLEELLEELKGYGGDHQWEGSWYPQTLIDREAFVDYAQELAEDCGMVNSDAKWPNNHIDWEAAARELEQDYSTVDVEGREYLYR